MPSPSTLPIEIKIRNGIATSMRVEMLTNNDYYYNVGDINTYQVSNVSSWPRVLIKIENEEILDQEGNHPTFSHYTNKLNIGVKYELKSHVKPGEVDRDTEAAKLAHDLKKFFGDYCRLESYGCYQVRPISYEMLHSSNESMPTAIQMNVECEYYQNRLTPTTG